MPKEDLKKALEIITEKAPRQIMAWRYYEGDHPLVFSTDRLRETFKDAKVSFVENWIAVVCDSVIDRMQMTGFAIGDGETLDTRAERLNEIYDADSWATLADDVHQSLVVTGEAFVIVQSMDNDIEAYLQPSAIMAAVYDDERPKVLKYAAKIYQEEEKKYRAILYYDTRMETWECQGRECKADKFNLVEEATLTEMPVFHFRAARKIKPTFETVIPLQDAVNKQFSDLMVTSDFQAFPLRYAITNAALPDRLPLSPGALLELPAGGGGDQSSTIGQLPAADLGIYRASMDRLASSMAAISRTPKHYFIAQGGDPSGEALQAQEAPLIKKVERLTSRIRPVWSAVGAYALRLAGETVTADEVTVTYGEPRTVQSYSQAQTRKMNVDAGIPITTQLRDEGWRDAELEQMQADKQAERGPVDMVAAPPDNLAQNVVTTESIAPLVESAIATIADAALVKVMESGKMEQLAKLTTGTSA